jgi:hypothetical protein
MYIAEQSKMVPRAVLRHHIKSLSNVAGETNYKLTLPTRFKPNYKRPSTSIE